MDNFIRAMVRGTTWKCRMDNDAIFEIWTPYILKRKEAIEQLLTFANGDYGNIYSRKDIVSVWNVAG